MCRREYDDAQLHRKTSFALCVYSEHSRPHKPLILEVVYSNILLPSSGVKYNDSQNRLCDPDFALKTIHVLAIYYIWVYHIVRTDIR